MVRREEGAVSQSKEGKNGMRNPPIPLKASPWGHQVLSSRHSSLLHYGDACYNHVYWPNEL